MELASFGSRAGAFIFDYIVASLLLGIGYGVLPPAFPSEATERFLRFLEVAGLILYHTLFLSVWSTTPGKKLYGLKVIPFETAGKVTFGRALARSASYLLSSWLLGLGFWWAAFGKSRTAWHDSIADTRVIVIKKKNLAFAVILTVVISAAMLVLIVMGLSTEAAEAAGRP